MSAGVGKRVWWAVLSPLRGLAGFVLFVTHGFAPSTGSGQAVGCILSPLRGSAACSLRQQALKFGAEAPQGLKPISSHNPYRSAESAAPPKSYYQCLDQKARHQE